MVTLLAAPQSSKRPGRCGRICSVREAEKKCRSRALSGRPATLGARFHIHCAYCHGHLNAREGTEYPAGMLDSARLQSERQARWPARGHPPIPAMQTVLWILTHEDLRRTAWIRAFIEFAAIALARHRALLEGNKALARSPSSAPASSAVRISKTQIALSIHTRHL